MIKGFAVKTCSKIEITTLVVMGLITFLALLGYLVPQCRQALFILAPILMVISICCYLRSPVAYEITSDNRLIVRFRLGSKVFHHVKVARATDPLNLCTIRLWGNGGLFAVTGLYWNSKLGRFYAYLTELNHLVLVELQDGRKIVISPENENAWR